MFTPGFKLCASYVKLCANFVQFSANSVQSSASSPVQVCHRPISWREMLLAILVSPSPYYDNSDSQRLRFVILEDILGHTLASWVLRPGNQKEWRDLGPSGTGQHWFLCTKCLQPCAAVCKMFTTVCKLVQVNIGSCGANISLSTSNMFAGNIFSPGCKPDNSFPDK